MDLGPDGITRTLIELAISVVLFPAVLLLLSKVALASLRPEPHEFSEVRRLANELDGLAHEVLQQATHAFVSAAGERRALDELIRFVDRVETFRKRFRAAGRAHASLERDFLLLQADHDRAAQSFRYLMAFRLSKDKFLSLSGCMEELRFYYAAPSFRPPSPLRSGRKDDEGRQGQQHKSLQ
jgi:hypothetical protein